MASASARLHLLCLSQSLRRKASLPAGYSCLSSYPKTPQFSFFSSSPPPPPPPKLRKTRINAMAKRGFSPLKDDQVASPADLRFEVPLKIIKYPDPRLRVKNKRISTFDDNLNKLVHEMFDVMYKTDGIGLSAPQVGINVQLMVFNPVGERGQGEEIVLVNPRVIKSSKRRVPFNEGCLSFPGIYADVEGELLKHRVLFSHRCRRSDYSGYVYPYGYSFLAKLHMKSLDLSPGHFSEVMIRERPESVKVDAQDIAGERFMVDLSGLPARVFQHEFDHLQGIVFFDRMVEDVLDSIRADLQALENQYEVSTGLPSPERVEARRKKVAVGFGRYPSAEA